MRIRIVSMVMAFAITFGAMFVISVPDVFAAEPHYYATALQEFISNATGKVTAVLFDIDGCGNEEMIVVDEGILEDEDQHWAALRNGDKIMIFDSKIGNGISTTVDFDISMGCSIYITNQHYLVATEAFESFYWEVYKYENGTKVLETTFCDASYNDVGPFLINGIECSKSELYSALNEYGLAEYYDPDAAILIWKGGVNSVNMPTTDHTAKILAMTTIAEQNIKVFLNGVELFFDVQPQIINGRTMVPMRKIFEALETEVEWDGDTQTITAKRDGTVVVTMQVNNAEMKVNGQDIILDAPPQIVDGTTLVPARAVAEGLNAKVDWIDETQTVTITTNETITLPDNSYIGNWYIKDLSGNITKYDELTILEINDDRIEFMLGIFRLCTIYATATIEGNEIKFIGLDPSGDDNIYGTLEFTNNAIQLTINRQNWTYELPKSLTFNYKE